MAKVAFNNRKQIDGFEIIDDNQQKLKDKDLLNK